jgi:hypothetical protein
MGKADQQPLGIHFLLSTEMKSAEAHLVSYVAEEGFHIDSAFGLELLFRLGGEIVPCLPGV